MWRQEWFNNHPLVSSFFFHFPLYYTLFSIFLFHFFLCLSLNFFPTIFLGHSCLSRKKKHFFIFFLFVLRLCIPSATHPPAPLLTIPRRQNCINSASFIFLFLFSLLHLFEEIDFFLHCKKKKIILFI